MLQNQRILEFRKDIFGWGMGLYTDCGVVLSEVPVNSRPLQDRALKDKNVIRIARLSMRLKWTWTLDMISLSRREIGQQCKTRNRVKGYLFIIYKVFIVTHKTFMVKEQNEVIIQGIFQCTGMNIK